MIFRALITLTLFASAGLRAQESKSDGRDRALEEMDARLQEQRAIALRARLLGCTDELELLHARFTAAGDTAAAALVKADMDAIQAAMTQLANIARRQADPPAPGELKENEQLSPAALAARRIDRIIARFVAAKGQVRPAPGAPALSSRPRTLKMDKAQRSSSFDDSEEDYWHQRGSYAQWTIPDLAPGNYEIFLRCTTGPDAGGKAVVKIAGQSLNVTVPRSDKDRREQRLPAGTVTIKEPGVDLRVENEGLAPESKYLWKLDSVVLQPAAKRP